MKDETPTKVNAERIAIVRSFNNMPGGAGLFQYYRCEDQTEYEFLHMTAHNLEKLRDSLVTHYALCEKQMTELMSLQRQRQAMRDFLGLTPIEISTLYHGTSADCPDVQAGTSTRCPGHKTS